MNRNLKFKENDYYTELVIFLTSINCACCGIHLLLLQVANTEKIRNA